LPENKFSLRLTNSREPDLIVWLEPWGEQHRLIRGVTLTILAEGPSGDTLEIEYGENGFTVYGWPGCVISTVLTVSPKPSEDRKEQH
jgi:hypothetical protein